METLIVDNKLEDLIKQAIIEAIDKKKDVVHDIFVEAREDVAMIRAIQDDESSGPISRDEIFGILTDSE